jgi:hypothetical protein
VAHALIAPTTFRAGAFSQTIGPNGGVLYFGVGSLTFPADALREWTRITATVDGLTIGATFSPHGLVFPPGSQPTLTFYLGPMSRPQSGASILYVTDDGIVLENLGAALTSRSESVEAPVPHFSKFIFGAN